MEDIEKSREANVSLRSESVQEILGKVPHALIRWGNTIILFLSIGTLMISYFVHYPLIIHGSAELAPHDNITEIYAPITGKLIGWNVISGDSVSNNATLGVIISSNGNTYELTSPLSGKAYTTSTFIEGGIVNNGDLLFKILPSKPKNYQAIIKLSPSFSGKIMSGQKVQIKFSERESQKNVITGYVTQVSRIADDQGMFSIQILISNGVGSIDDEYLIQITRKKVKAEIIVGNPRLLEYFFASTKSIFNF